MRGFRSKNNNAHNYTTELPAPTQGADGSQCFPTLHKTDLHGVLMQFSAEREYYCVSYTAPMILGRTRGLL